MRAPVHRWILLVLTLALVTASCGGGDGGDTQQVESSFTPPRTYEDLDPGGVAREFADSRGMSDAGAPDYGTRRWAEWTLGRAAVRDAAETVD
ncbi:MAG: hypothetical protein EBY49_01440 [Actinobacteria bacterium]|nr:hypothetical protein [Actinomycetota bacterium]